MGSEMCIRDSWAGVRPGMEVARIGGVPAEERYARALAAEREQSTPWAKERRAFRALLRGEPESKLAFEFVRGDGSTIATTLEWKVVRAGSSANSRKLPSGFGYIRFSDFSWACLLYTSPSPRARTRPRMPPSA